VLDDAEGRTVFINQAAEQLFELSSRTMIRASFARMFANGMVIDALVEEACNNAFGQKRQDLVLERTGREPILSSSTAVVLDSPLGALLLEFREIDAPDAARSRVQRMLDSAQANRELVRNLAHEIKNPLGASAGRPNCSRPNCRFTRAARIHPGDHQGGRSPAGAGRPSAGARIAMRACGRR
jgi:two-component system nitrogen regulation sensor histidine kinase GlnL